MRAVASSELCSLVRPTTGEPSRSCHGEGHVRQALFRGQPGGFPRGMGGGTCTQSGSEQERPVCLALSGKDQGYKPMVKVCPAKLRWACR